jgi:hypothetical protein
MYTYYEKCYVISYILVCFIFIYYKIAFATNCRLCIIGTYHMMR